MGDEYNPGCLYPLPVLALLIAGAVAVFVRWLNDALNSSTV